jgi:hypothetical protein
MPYRPATSVVVCISITGQCCPRGEEECLECHSRELDVAGFFIVWTCLWVLYVWRWLLRYFILGGQAPFFRECMERSALGVRRR